MRSSPALRRVLSIPRNIDTKPPAGIEFFGSVYGAIVAGGAAQELVLGGPGPIGAFPRQRLFTMRLRHVRVEWQQLDVTVPPALAVWFFVNQTNLDPAGRPIGEGLSPLSFVPLQATSMGTPAMDIPLGPSCLVEPNGLLRIWASNFAGTVNPQNVSVSFWGWLLPVGLRDG